MPNFIEDFYYGKLEPQATPSGETNRAALELSACEKELRELICGEALLLLEKYEKAWEELLSLSNTDSFVSGFKHGAMFSKDVFQK